MNRRSANWRTANWRTTYDLLHYCINLVARVLIVTLTLGCFLAVGVGFDWMLKSVLEFLKAPVPISDALAQITFLYVIIIASAGLVSGAAPVFVLTYFDYRNLLTSIRNGQDGIDNNNASE